MTTPIALIVEDDETLAHIFAQALQAAGFDTAVAQDGDAAWAQLEKVVPAMLVLDLHLPGLSGPAVLEKVRQDGRFADTRVIIASADAELADMLRDQADLVLEKPVSFHQLRLLSSRFKPD